MVDPAEVQRCIEVALPGAAVDVADTTGAGDHFEVRVRAAQFEGLGLVEQHRLIYGALDGLMPRIHALSLRTEPAGKDAS
jgi:stress-induced morphogen